MALANCHGTAPSGGAWRDRARRGMAGSGPARHGMDSFKLVAVPQIVKIRRGEVWRGTVWPGRVGQGKDSFKSWWRYANRRLWHGMTVQGFAGQGSARSGLAWFSF